MSSGQSRPLAPQPISRRTLLALAGAACLAPRAAAARQASFTFDAATSSYHVYPGGRIQDALEAAARDPENKTVLVHAGTYRPAAPGQALIWFNARHDGITLEAIGDVTLTAANPALADRRRAQPSRGRQPRRLLRRRHLAQDGPARLQDHRRQQLHDRLRREVADRVRRHPQDAVLLHRRRRHQDLRALVSRPSSTSRSSATTPAPAAAASRSSISARLQESVLFRALHLPQQPHADHRRRRRPAARQPARRSRTACSSATSRTWASTTSGC